MKPFAGTWVLFVADVNNASHTTSLHLKQNAIKCADKKPTCQNPPIQERGSYFLSYIATLSSNVKS